jgi:hypothetical protein
MPYVSYVSSKILTSRDRFHSCGWRSDGAFVPSQGCPCPDRCCKYESAPPAVPGDLLSSWPQTPLQHTSYLLIGTQSTLGAQISGHDLVHAQISGHTSDPLAGFRCGFVLRGSRSSRAGGHKYAADIEVAGPARVCYRRAIGCPNLIAVSAAPPSPHALHSMSCISSSAMPTTYDLPATRQLMTGALTLALDLVGHRGAVDRVSATEAD